MYLVVIMPMLMMAMFMMAVLMMLMVLVYMFLAILFGWVLSHVFFKRLINRSEIGIPIKIE